MKRFGTDKSLSAAICLVALCFIVAGSAKAQYSVVHNFAGTPNDGAFPNGELIQDAAGNLYGTTDEGGAGNNGAIFRLDTDGVITILNDLTSDAGGGRPEGGLLRDEVGNFYGTTSFDPGGVFRLDVNNSLKSLHAFGIGDDGGNPISRLVTINGDLYGVTTEGGGSSCGCGTIFRMTKGGTETILYSFTGAADGASPLGVFRDSVGNLYGVAQSGGAGSGTVWKLSTGGVFTVVYTFTGGTDGGMPAGRVIVDGNGNIHGVTASGGDPTCNCGVIFRVDENGKETVLHRFFGRGGGAHPSVGLLDVGGALYGTTDFGGDLTCNPPIGCGVLYQVGKSGRYTVLRRFAGASAGDGAYSAVGALTLGGDGNIYGATWYGGTGTSCSGSIPGCGVIFRYNP
jgi:uncharacterized repeat protein (TIGR03803 family)